MKQWATNLQQNTFNGIDNINIAYAYMKQPNDAPALVIVNGRSESYLKYQDVANFFYQKGVSVYMLDHRGQGLSQRLIDDSEKGHVSDFNHYVEDLAVFVNHVVLAQTPTQLMMLGHSMGGAIVTRYLQSQPHQVSKAILASPMHGILLPAPTLLIKLVASCLIAIERLVNRPPNYVLGGEDYLDKPFEDNELTSSKARYKQFAALYRDKPQIQLGSPTNKWLLESLKACDLCIAQAHKITIPLLLLQAGSDTIVDNKAQNEFGRRVDHHLLSTNQYTQARHEILFEVDAIRQVALETATEFLEI